jgi:hypothetical protein
MCAKGTGVAKDEARAFGLYKQVCDGGNMYGCALVGTSYVNGTGVEKDEAHGLALLQQMCDGGKMDGCTALGSIWVMKDEARGVAFYKQACDSGSKGGCSSIETLGMMYALNNNRARADELFRLLPPQRSPSTPVTAPVTLPVIDPSNKRIGFTLVTDFKNKAPRANVEIFFAYYEPKSKSWEKSNQRSGADGNCVFGVPAGRKGESNTFVWASTAKDLDDRMSAVADGKFPTKSKTAGTRSPDRWRGSPTHHQGERPDVGAEVKGNRRLELLQADRPAQPMVLLTQRRHLGQQRLKPPGTLLRWRQF